MARKYIKKGKLKTHSWRTSGEFKKGRIPWNKGKKRPPFSEEWKRKIREAAIERRKNHWNWKGGISYEPYSVDWTKTLKRSIRERDNYICQLCSQYGSTVHHIDYQKKNCNSDNLITLCQGCNSKVNKNRRYWTDYFKRIK